MIHFGFFINPSYELVPELFKELLVVEQRRVFITQYNLTMDVKLRIAKADYEMRLEDIFAKKIDELISASTPKDELSCEIVSLYKMKDFEKLRSVNGFSAKHSGAQMISMIYGKEKAGLCFDARSLFSNYVFEKVSKRHEDKTVMFKKDYLLVEHNGEKLMAVMPVFRYINKNKEHLGNEEIARAKAILHEEKVQTIFVTYPRNCDFTRYIDVQNDFNAKLTLVPYSISHKIIKRVSNY